jgi:serine/threonine protein phosphatase PrpC
MTCPSIASLSAASLESVLQVETQKIESTIAKATAVVFGGAESVFSPPKVKRLRKAEDKDAGASSQVHLASGGCGAVAASPAGFVAKLSSGLVFQEVSPESLITNLHTELGLLKKLDAQPHFLSKIQKNAKKALVEHIELVKDPLFITEDEFHHEVSTHPEALAIEKAFSSVSVKGARPSHEDFFSKKESDNFTFIVLLDGHGGKAVAEFAGHALLECMSYLEQNCDNLKLAIETVFELVQKQIRKNLKWNAMGSTAVCCFIQKKTGLVYTATLGDSEANIYRKVGESIKSIPLSCVRNWHSLKDSVRYANFYASRSFSYLFSSGEGAAASSPEALQKAEVDKILAKIRSQPSKIVRTKHMGLNVSRSFGDDSPKDKHLVIQKPKVSVFEIKPKDILVIACDGLKDYVSESKIIEQISLKDAENNLAQRLLDCVPGKAIASPDNVTIACLEF